MSLVAAEIAFVAVACLAALWDIRYRRIPNWLTLTGLAAALVLRALPGGEGVVAGLAGAGTGLGIGFALFAAGLIGAGDAKFMAALGAFLGPLVSLQAFALGAVLGGILAVADAARRGVLPLLVHRSLQAFRTLPRGGTLTADAPPESGRLAIPYGVPLALGAVVWKYWGGAILEVLV
jgi:prepilin peptidase CpaA